MILTVTLNPTVDKSYYVEKLTPGEVIRVHDKKEAAGGKGINVAKVAKLLGEDVVATGFLGGRNGDYIESVLTGLGIVTSFVRTPDETRTCVSINDESSGRQTELLEAGAFVTAEKRAAFTAHYTQLLGQCETVVLSGSVPAGVDDRFYPELIKIAKDAGKKVVLDTSGSLLKEGIEARPDMIKPNRDELISLLGREIKTVEEVITAAREIQAKGIETVIVSLGKDGAVFAVGDRVYRGKTPDIKIVNTVACGDSLVAGFLTGIRRKIPLEDAIKLAMAVSTANALRKEIGFFVQNDLDRLLGQVGAVKID